MPRIKHKRGTSANLASVNPTPLAGELVWDSTENAIKIGDGATAWTSLAYVTATPRTHTHSADAITSGTVAYARLPVGSTTSTVCAGDDARLTDARTPTAHKASHATGGSDALTPGDIGAAPAASPAITGNATFEASSGVPVTITNTGTGNSFVVNDAAGDTTPFVVDADGRVLVGATSGTFPFTLVANSSAQSIQIRGRPADGIADLQMTSNDGNTRYFYLTSRSTHVEMRAPSGGYLSMADFNGVSAIYISSGRNVGIGNRTSPASALDVNGIITVSATSGSAGSYQPSVTFSGDANTGFGQVSGQSDSASIFTAGSERVRVDANGNVGIGVSVDASFANGYKNLVVGNGGGTRGMTIYANPANASTIAFADGPSGAASFAGFINYLHADDAFSIGTNATARVRISSAGHVGLLTDAPTAALDINADKIRLRTAKTPASASDTGNAGDICWDASYLYICTATNTWRRIAHSTW